VFKGLTTFVHVRLINRTCLVITTSYHWGLHSFQHNHCNLWQSKFTSNAW